MINRRIAAFCVFSALGFNAGEPRIGLAAETPSHRRGEILVRLMPGTPASEKSRLAADHRLTLLREYSGLRCTRFKLPEGVAIESAVSDMSRDARVASAQPNYVYTIAVSPEDQYFRDDDQSPNQWGLFKTYVPSLWRATGGGLGQTIAFLDTGVDAGHPDLSPNVLAGGYDFVNDDASPDDDEGHGTHIAGIACAATDIAGTGIAGVAYEGKILAVKVLDEDGEGNTADIAEGLLYAAGTGIINMSFAGSSVDCLMQEAVATAYEAGSVLVAASGNGGGSALKYPAGYDGVISVGAVDSTKAVWIHSNYGHDLDVVAPGSKIYSTKLGGGYEYEEGTSEASAFVSGVCALLRSEFPGIKAWELEEFLRHQARNIDGLDPGDSGNRDGHGLVSFGTLQDWSNGSLTAASSGNSFFEWLGAEVTGESSLVDAGAVDANDGDDALPDLDGVANSDGSGEDNGDDGGDDGIFPHSHTKLPILPIHLETPEQFFDIKVSVADRTGRRYANGQTITVRSWLDWNGDDSFAHPGEQLLSHTIAPAGLAANLTTHTLSLSRKEDHLLGNPLRIRTRLYGPTDTPGGPYGAQDFGEVEDQQVLNFVEDFDRVFHDTDPEVFATLGPTWAVAPDPFGGFSNHSAWEMAFAAPVPESPCAADDELVLPHVGALPLDLTELTKCKLHLWVAHCLCPCQPGYTDDCRIVIRHSPESAGPFTDTLLMDLPSPFCIGCGPPPPPFEETLEFDLSAYCGEHIRIVVKHKCTNARDRLAVDDVVVWGWDEGTPQPVASNGAAMSDMREVTMGWDHPEENEAGSPSDPKASIYAARLWSGGTFDDAFRLTPRDFANGGSLFPEPGDAGGSAVAGFLAPTLFSALSLGLRAEDEVGNRGATTVFPLSAAPSFDIGAIGPLAEIVAAPGDTVRIGFTSSNDSSALDALSYAASDTVSPSWLLCPSRWIHVLRPGDGEIDSVTVVVPVTAHDGDRDLTLVEVKSLSDPSLEEVALARIVVTEESAGVGACCLPGGACELLTSAECDAGCGLHGGVGSLCGPIACPDAFRVIGSSPEPGATGVALLPSVTVNFSDPVLASDLTSETFRVTGKTSGPAPGTIEVAGDALSGTIRIYYGPTRVLDSGQLIETTVARGIRSAQGQSLARPRVLHFRTLSQRGTGGFAPPVTLNPASSVVVVSAGDLNQDGKTDLAACGLAGKVNVYRNVTPEGGSLSYESSSYSIGSSLTSLALIDFDTDGDLDVVATDQAAGLVRIGSNDGTGASFTWSSVASGTGPYDIGAGDLDGDGLPDLAVPCEGSNNVYVYLGDGSGGVRETGIYAVADDPTDLDIRDLDLDGDLDLVVMHWDGQSLTVMTNDDPAAAAASMFSIRSTLPVGSPRGLLLEDLNSDRRPDVVVATETDARVCVVMGGACATLEAPVCHETGGAAGNLGRSVASLDFDGDGDQDLAMTNSTTNRWVLLENDGAAGFTIRNTLATQTRPIVPLAADLNNDGIMDVAIPTRVAQKIEIFLGIRPSADVSPEVPSSASELATLRAQPNPFRDSVQLHLPGSGPGRAEVFDTAGRLVRKIAVVPTAGAAEVTWDGRDESREPVSSGLYLLRVTRGTARTALRIVKVR